MLPFYFHRGTRRAALFYALVPTVCACFFLPLPHALLLGAGLCLFLSLLLPFLLYLGDRPYIKLGHLLPQKTQFRERIYVEDPAGKRGVDACLYLCEDGAYLCAFARRFRPFGCEPYLFCKIPAKCVESIRTRSYVGQLRLSFYDGTCLDFLCMRETPLLQACKECGFCVYVE